MVYNRRNITHKLILTILILTLSICPIFASTPEIEIDHNDNEYFHAYNSNTNVANSYIDSGAAVFSKAMNYMFMNIAKSTSSVYSIQNIANNIYTRLGTIDTDISNSSSNIVTAINQIYVGLFGTNGIASNIASIKTYSQNLYDYVSAQDDIKWTNINISSINAASSTQNAFDGTYINSARLVGTDVYIRIDLANNPSYSSIMKFVLPLIPYNSTSEFILSDVYIMNSVNSGWAYIESPNTKLTGNTSNNTSTIYYDGFIRSYAGANISNKILLHITSNQSIYYLYNNKSQASVSYITTSKKDYHTVYDTYLLEQINNKELSANVNFDDSDIIDAINNLSLQDNDVKLNLTINNNTGTDGTNIITRLQNFFNTGVSVGDFFDNVDDAESGWFTQSNSDVINTLRGGYTNFYE